MDYGNVTLIDGPSKGERIPVHGRPRYGFCLQVDRTVRNGVSKFDVVDIYKIIVEDYDNAKARYVGTLR